MARRQAPSIPDAVLDQLLDGLEAKDAFGRDGLLDALKKALAERALGGLSEISCKGRHAAIYGDIECQPHA